LAAVDEQVGAGQDLAAQERVAETLPGAGERALVDAPRAQPEVVRAVLGDGGPGWSGVRRRDGLQGAAQEPVEGRCVRGLDEGDVWQFQADRRGDRRLVRAPFWGERDP